MAQPTFGPHLFGPSHPSIRAPSDRRLHAGKNPNGSAISATCLPLICTGFVARFSLYKAVPFGAMRSVGVQKAQWLAYRIAPRRNDIPEHLFSDRRTRRVCRWWVTSCLVNRVRKCDRILLATLPRLVVRVGHDFPHPSLPTSNLWALICCSVPPFHISRYV